MIRYLNISILLSLLLVSCVSRKGNENTFSEKEIFVKSKVIVSQDKLLDPRTIAICDSILILGNYKGNPLVEVYNIKGKLLQKDVQKGKGPNEVSMIGNFQIDEKKNLLYIYDLFEKKIIIYDLKLFQLSEYFSMARLKNNNFLIDNLIVGDSVFICESRSPEGRILTINQSDYSNCKYQIDYPDKHLILDELNDMQNARLYASAITMSPNNKYVAMGTYIAGILELYKVNGSSLSITYTLSEFYPQGVKIMNAGDYKMVLSTDDSVKGYCGIDCTNNFVYCLYSGKSFGTDGYSKSNIVRVTNWNGTKRYVYKLDRDVISIAVSSDDNSLYAISNNDKGEPEIIKFEL